MQVKQESTKNQRLTRPLGEPAADSFISLTAGSHPREDHLITKGHIALPTTTCGEGDECVGADHIRASVLGGVSGWERTPPEDDVSN